MKYNCIIRYDFIYGSPKFFASLFSKMISTTYIEIALQKGFDKVLYLFPAEEETFVLLVHRESGADVLVHCDSYGKALKEFVFEQIVSSLAVPSGKEAIVLRARKNCIFHMELQEYEIKEIPFQFMQEDTQLSKIHCFSETNLFCLAEWGSFNDHRLRLSYFQNPITMNSKPIYCFEAFDNQWTTGHRINRANNHSKFVWYLVRQDEDIQIRVFELHIDQKQINGEFKIVGSRSYANYYGMNQCDLAINRVWQSSHEKYMLAILSSRGDLLRTSQKTIFNPLMVLDAHTSTLRQCRFIIPKPYNQLTIDHRNFGFYSMVRTYAFDNSRARLTPVYYINNITETLILEQKWECSHLNKDFVAGYDGTLLVAANYDNEDVNTIKISLKQPFNGKMLALHLLLEIYEQFDDNLLAEVIDCLPRHDQSLI